MSPPASARTARHRRIVAAIVLPRLPSELLRLPESEPHAVALHDPAGSAMRIVRSVTLLVDATTAARQAGVAPGQRVVDAQLHVPHLKVSLLDMPRLSAELQILGEILLGIAPVVEPLPLQTQHAAACACIVVDLTGVPLRAEETSKGDGRGAPAKRLLHALQNACAQAGHRSIVVASPAKRLSIALAMDVAAEAAHGSGGRYGGRTLLEVHDVERALDVLSVHALSLSKELSQAVQALGVHTAADLLRLVPRGGIERMGAEARQVIEVLTARDAPLRGISAPERALEAIELEVPLHNLAALQFLLKPMCERLVLRARARHARVAAVRLDLVRRGREPHVISVAFPTPLVSDKPMLRALSLRLEHVAAALAERAHAKAERNLPRLLAHEGNGISQRHVELLHADGLGPVDGLVLELTALAHAPPAQLALEPGMKEQEAARDAVHGLLAELSAELGVGRVGCMTSTHAVLPEHMTALSWPIPEHRAPDHALARRRPRPAVLEKPEDRARFAGGRFLASWPWPLHLLKQPVRFHGALAEERILGVLEGEDAQDRPFSRAYLVLLLHDGRRALGIRDDEADALWVHGWFD